MKCRCRIVVVSFRFDMNKWEVYILLLLSEGVLWVLGFRRRVPPAVFSYVGISCRLLGEGCQVWCWYPVVSVDRSCFCLVVRWWLSRTNCKLSLSSLLDVGSWLLNVWFWMSGVAGWLSVLVIAQFSVGSDHLCSYLSFYSFILWRHLRVSTSKKCTAFSKFLNLRVTCLWYSICDRCKRDFLLEGQIKLKFYSEGLHFSIPERNILKTALQRRMSQRKFWRKS